MKHIFCGGDIEEEVCSCCKGLRYRCTKCLHWGSYAEDISGSDPDGTSCKGFELYTQDEYEALNMDDEELEREFDAALNIFSGN